MPEEKPAPAESGCAATGYSYPGDIARFVRDQWRDALGARLQGASLQGARVTDEQLGTTRSLEDATMPDGSKHP